MFDNQPAPPDAAGSAAGFGIGFGPGAAVTGAAVTGAPVTGAPVTGVPVTGAAVTGAGDFATGVAWVARGPANGVTRGAFGIAGTAGA